MNCGEVTWQERRVMTARMAKSWPPMWQVRERQTGSALHATGGENWNFLLLKIGAKRFTQSTTGGALCCMFSRALKNGLRGSKFFHLILGGLRVLRPRVHTHTRRGRNCTWNHSPCNIFAWLLCLTPVFMFRTWNMDFVFYAENLFTQTGRLNATPTTLNIKICCTWQTFANFKRNNRLTCQ